MQLIMYAYKLQRYEISGPEWMVTDRFDIDGEAAGWRYERRCAGDAARTVERTI
jgi:uncharacterized protein (TIGR03435 family)